MLSVRTRRLKLAVAHLLGRAGDRRRRVTRPGTQAGFEALERRVLLSHTSLGDPDDALESLDDLDQLAYAVGTPRGAEAGIVLFAADGDTIGVINPFPGFHGGVNVALADVNGDGVQDVIAGAGPGGGPHVKVFDGTDLSGGTLLANFFAYDAQFSGGVNVGAANIDGAPGAEILTGAGAGGPPLVKAFSLGGPGLEVDELASFLAYDANFGGGVHVTGGNFNGTGQDEIITAAGAGGGPHVKVYDGDSLGAIGSPPANLSTEFFAYGETMSSGVSVASGDLNGDGLAEIITAPGEGADPTVRIFAGGTGELAAQFHAYDEDDIESGVTVAAVDVPESEGDDDPWVDIMTVAAEDDDELLVKFFDGDLTAEDYEPDKLEADELFEVEIDDIDDLDRIREDIEDRDKDDDHDDDRDDQEDEFDDPEDFLRSRLAERGYDEDEIEEIVDELDDVLDDLDDDDFDLDRDELRSLLEQRGFDDDEIDDLEGIFDEFLQQRVRGPAYALGTGPGVEATVLLYDSEGEQIAAFNPYPGFHGGVSVALADVDGDGVQDIITGAGPGGGPHVKVFDGTDLTGGTLLANFFAYDTAFTGGVFVGAADLDDNFGAEVLTGAGAGGGPHVKAFALQNAGLNVDEVASFFAYDPAFAGGVRVAGGDFNGTGGEEIITAAGPGGGPHVKVYDADSLGAVGIPPANLLASFYAYGETESSGVYVASADVNGDGLAEIITGPGRGADPTVRIFAGGTAAMLAQFHAFDDDDLDTGVTVGIADVPISEGDDDPWADIITAPAPVAGADVDPRVRLFDGDLTAEDYEPEELEADELDEFFAEADDLDDLETGLYAAL